MQRYALAVKRSSELAPAIRGTSIILALAYNLGNFMQRLALPKTAEPRSLTSLNEKLSKIGAKVVRHGRYVTFQMAEAAVSRQMFAGILSLSPVYGAPPAPA